MMDAAGLVPLGAPTVNLGRGPPCRAIVVVRCSDGSNGPLEPSPFPPRWGFKCVTDRDDRYFGLTSTL